MKKFLLLLCFLFATTSIGEAWYLLHPLAFPTKSLPIPKPLLVYSFDNLKKDHFPTTQITLGNVVSTSASYFSQVFTYQTPDKPNSSHLLTVSGLMNSPSQPGTYPVIVMLRGFVPSSIYAPGVGTEPVAKVLAQNGFITLAPDFLGYAESSPGAVDSFENRFQTYTTTLSLLSSLATLNNGLAASYSAMYTGDLSKTGIWAHSNGGHIALSTLAISGVTYPTVLWAPVSTSFPYDILYYTDESDDQGKVLRKILAQFETIYDTGVFSLPNYYNWIKATLDIEQGTADVEVPFWWSDNLVATLKKNNLDVTYNTHPGADHNMLPTSTWNSAVENTLSFFKKKLNI